MIMQPAQWEPIAKALPGDKKQEMERQPDASTVHLCVPQGMMSRAVVLICKTSWGSSGKLFLEPL